jgi:hypothetical protein
MGLRPIKKSSVADDKFAPPPHWVTGARIIFMRAVLNRGFGAWRAKNSAPDAFQK